jgi:hypothetical protein
MAVTDMPNRKKQRSRPKQGKHRRSQMLKSESTLTVIDRLLLVPVRTSLNGEQATIPALEAIMLQLIRAEAAGDARASAVLLKYKELAKRDGAKRPQIVFADSD